MRLTRRIFVTFLYGTFLLTGAHAADSACDDIKYRTANPDKCADYHSDDNLSTFTIIGATATGIAGAVAAFGLMSSGGGGNTSAPVATPDAPAVPRVPGYPAPQLGGNRGDLLGDVTDDVLKDIMADSAYIRNSHIYDEIGAAYSRGRGYTGAGATIAIMDTGRGYWHGRVVSDIAGAFIAPGAEIKMYQIATNTSNFFTWAEIGDTIATASIDANIINNSWNISESADTINSREQIAAITDAGFVRAISDAAARGAIFVWAAGNDGAMQSGALSAMPGVMPELHGHFINVVAWDSETGALADYSNACGITMNWCITAPGTGVSSGYYTVNGTSFAAPMVSAAIAVLQEAFPYLAPEQITELLFVTATDLGTPGVDEIYGHGMMDLERATRPVGDAAIVTAGGQVMPLRAARINGAIAQKLRAADLKFAYFDAFGRPFQARLADNIHMRNRGLGFDRLRGDARMSMHIGPVELGFARSDFLAGDGFLQTDGGATTTFVATDNKFNMGDLEIFQRTQIGLARPHPATDSIIMEFSRTTTAAATVGVRHGQWMARVGIPETIIDGTMNLRIPVDRAANGDIVYRDRVISTASAPAFEYAVGFAFMTLGFIDNPFGTDEIYVIAKSKIHF